MDKQLMENFAAIVRNWRLGAAILDNGNNDSSRELAKEHRHAAVILEEAFDKASMFEPNDQEAARFHKLCQFKG